MARFQDVGGHQTQFMGPEAAGQSRKLAEALINEGMDTKGLTHWTQALGKVLQSGVGHYQNARATADVRDGSMAGNQALAQMLAGGSPDAAMANPYSASDALKMQVADRNASRSFANQKALLEEKLRMQNADPMRQLQMEKMRADIEATRSGGGMQTRVGLQPIYGRDAQNNIVVLQPSASGQMIQSQVPDGVTIDPGLVAGAKAQATAAGKWEGGADQRQVGKERLTNQLGGMVRDYLTLNERGGIVNPDRPAMENFKARVRSSEAGQAIGGAVGTEEQSIRNRIENVRPLLMQGIMQASGMSARALDSNRELDFYLRAATHPTQDIYSNLVAIDVLDKTYGMGGVLDNAVPPEILARVRTDAARAIESRPISTIEPGTPQAPQSQAAPAAPPPGNFVWNPQTRQLEAR